MNDDDNDNEAGKFDAVIVYAGPSGLTPEQLAKKKAEADASASARYAKLIGDEPELHLATEGRLVGHQALTDHELSEIERLQRLSDVMDRRIFGHDIG